MVFLMNDLNKWAEPSETYVGIRSEVGERDGYYSRQFLSFARPNKNAKVRKFKRKVETVPVSDKIVKSRIEKVNKTLEDVIVSDKNIKLVFQLPINNKKEISRLLPMMNARLQLPI